MTAMHRLAPAAALLGVLAVALSACGPGQGAVTALRPGQCVDQPASPTGVEEVEVVPCDDPHDLEVFALVELPEGPYPGADGRSQAAQEACNERFAAYVGVEPSASALATGFLVPTEEGWQAGDREVVCLLYEPDTRLTGSMRATQR